MPGTATGVLGLVAAAAVLALVIYWVYRLAKWDGDGSCDETECPSCPFPCEKHGDQ